jgi:hypothetical protein
VFSILTTARYHTECGIDKIKDNLSFFTISWGRTTRGWQRAAGVRSRGRTTGGWRRAAREEFSVQGGDTQEQNPLQFFLNMVEFGMNVQQAAEVHNISYQMLSVEVR